MSDNAGTWVEVGRLLGEARRRRRLTKRAAATRAGFSEITWRNLEAGHRQIAPGVSVPVSPKDETLERAALGVGLDPAVIFAAAGRNYEPLALIERDKIGPEPAQRGQVQVDYNSKIARLPAEDQAVVDALIDRLLRESD